MKRENNVFSLFAKSTYQRKALGLRQFAVICICLVLYLTNVGMISAQSRSDEKVDYTIASVKDFNNFITKLSNGDDFAGKYVKVVADIDFTGTTFKTIKNFQGTFDGSGHSFSGISGVSSIFDSIRVGATVKNLTVKNSTFASSNTTRIIGVITFVNTGVLDNCVSDATNTIETNAFAGGIVAINAGLIINCANYATITGEKGEYIAGIAYSNSGEIINSYNQGNMVPKNFWYSSGIVNFNTGNIVKCYNTGLSGYGIGSDGFIYACYFLDTASEITRTGIYNTKVMTQSEMSSQTLINLLNDGIEYIDGALLWEQGTLYPQHVPTYEIIFSNNFSNGVVESDYSYAVEGTKVTLTAKPSNKYFTEPLTVNTKEGISVPVNAKGNKFTFTMPSDNIVVNASFTRIDTPKNVKYTKSSKTISWDKTNNATGYEIYRSTSKTANYKFIKSVTDLKYKDSSASTTTTYYYKVKAYLLVDGEKTYSSLSSAVSSR